METFRTENGFPTIPKGVGDRLDYTFDFTDALAGDTIAAHAVTVQGVTKADEARTGTAVTVWAEGGILGAHARIQCAVDTAGGRRLVRTIVLKIAAR